MHLRQHHPFVAYGGFRQKQSNSFPAVFRHIYNVLLMYFYNVVTYSGIVYFAVVYGN